MTFRRGGKVLRLGRQPHATAEALEQYALGRLREPELSALEEHVLVCKECQDELAVEDAFTQGIRDASEVWQRQAAVSGRWSALFRPRPAWIVGLAACTLLTFAAVRLPSWRRAAAPPATVLLQSLRGAESPAIAAGQALTLAPDVTDLPQLAAYKLEVVDAGGRRAFQSQAVPANNRLSATLAKGLPAGEYFVRLYAPGGELLREYAMTVRP